MRHTTGSALEDGVGCGDDDGGRLGDGVGEAVGVGVGPGCEVGDAVGVGVGWGVGRGVGPGTGLAVGWVGGLAVGPTGPGGSVVPGEDWTGLGDVAAGPPAPPATSSPLGASWAVGAGTSLGDAVGLVVGSAGSDGSAIATPAGAPGTASGRMPIPTMIAAIRVGSRATATRRMGRGRTMAGYP